MFEEGNEYYKIRSKSGRDLIFTDPEQLRDKINEYFQFILDNPFKEQVLYHFQGFITKDHVQKMKPFSIEGLCVYLGIARRTFDNYELKGDFLPVLTHARQIIETQQFEGASSGFLNPNIIARKLGLADKQEVKHELPDDFEIVRHPAHSTIKTRPTQPE